MAHPFRFLNHNSTIVQVLHEQLDAGLRSTESHFNRLTANIDFAAFCLIYAVILIWMLRRANRVRAFRPKNKELVSTQSPTQVSGTEPRKQSWASSFPSPSSSRPPPGSSQPA